MPQYVARHDELERAASRAVAGVKAVLAGAVGDNTIPLLTVTIASSGTTPSQPAAMAADLRL